MQSLKYKKWGVFMKRNKKLSAIVAVAMALLLFLSSTAYAAPISNILNATFEVGPQTEVTVTDAGGLRDALTNMNITNINLAAGHYEGPFEITRDVTLNSAGEDKTFIDAPDGLEYKTISHGEGHISPIIYVTNGANVTIRNLTVDGLSKGETSESNFMGIAFHDAGGTVENVTVSDIRTDGYYQWHGTGIYALNEDGEERSLTIKNSSITNYQLNGVELVDLDGNLIVGITGNTFTGATSDLYDDEDSIIPPTGIRATGIDMDKLTLADNTYSNNDYDFVIEDHDPVTLSGKIDGGEFEYDEYGNGNISLSPEEDTPVSIELTANVNWLKTDLNADLILKFVDPAEISNDEITVTVGGEEIEPIDETNTTFILGTISLDELKSLEFNNITVTFTTGNESITYKAEIYVDDGTE